jgi:hypothetical protein
LYFSHPKNSYVSIIENSWPVTEPIAMDTWLFTLVFLYTSAGQTKKDFVHGYFGVPVFFQHMDRVYPCRLSAKTRHARRTIQWYFVTV